VGRGDGERRRGEVEKREKTSRGWAYLAGQVDEQVGNQAATATGSDSVNPEVVNKLTSCLWLT
jgi:hypothetical protein